MRLEKMNVMRLTVDEFWEEYPFQPYELIGGQVVKTETLGFRYSVVGMRVEAKLTEFVEHHNLGEVMGANNGYRLSQYTLRAPRVSYITNKKWRSIRYPYTYIPFPPDIAIEVFSTDVSEQTIRKVCAQYVRAGTHFVWVFLPDLQIMTSYSRHSAPRTFRRRDNLRVPQWHSDFIIPMAELLPKPRKYN